MGMFGDGGASDTIGKALDLTNRIEVPTAESMQVQLEQYVAAGILTPEEAQYYAQNPSEFAKIQINPKGEQTQVQAIDQLMGIANNGGEDAQSQNALQQTISALNTNDRGQRGAILQNAAERGALNSGMTTAAQLEANQTGAANANQQALQARSDAATRAMQALTTAGTMGANLQGQDWNQAATKASAADTINAFNTAQQNQTAQFNAANKNAANAANLTTAQQISEANTGQKNANTTRNADLIQQQFNNQLNKAQTSMGGAATLANQQASNSQSENAMAGNLIGAAATTLGTMYGGPVGGIAAGTAAKKVTTGADGGVMGEDNEIHAYLNGGKVPGEAPVPGDSPKNDVSPALLSPGEGVIPRSVMNAPDDRVLAFLHRMRKPEPEVNPKHVATVLAALHHLQGA